MSDIIRLLPDSVANQIAAGEVIQRPASAVKELLENAIDSGATEIKLIIKDAGKTLIQVIDNGCGMSETDARMSFERHATSKISEANDLFAIRTMGFRGEALASIAAIAQVELKSKKVEDELGTQIIIEGSEVKAQTICSTTNGTSISIKNLFFNVPARRNFLKSNQIETKHIFDEFFRVALANPDVAFSVFDNSNQRFALNKSNLKQRIAGLFGSSIGEKLVDIKLESDIVKISGFIGKADSAKKTRGEQYFFVNNRFIKHPYFNHAVENAYQELLPENSHPSYFVFFQINPEKIDINIHPTKTEVNFQDSNVIYSILLSAVKQSLGKFSITPSIDFSVEQSFDYKHIPNAPIKQPKISINPDFNPFEQRSPKTEREKSNADNWQELFVSKEFKAPDFGNNKTEDIEDERQTTISSDIDEEHAVQASKLIQLHNKYILANVKSGLLIVNQQNAFERIYYEKFLKNLETDKSSTQQQLFPQTLEFNASDAELLNEISDELTAFGFDIKSFGANSFIVNGIPTDLTNENLKDLLDGILEYYKKNLIELKIDKRINVLRSMARNLSIRQNVEMQTAEMQALIDSLFACKLPETTPSGKKVFKILNMEDINSFF
ncbi:MAG: DNA mismatch repair endonuclease MutL [Saprospiraceae bacterium]|nr:DNA mismatch repair endonuclease MutL [Saprospiraceae bacterium]